MLKVYRKNTVYLCNVRFYATYESLSFDFGNQTGPWRLRICSREVFGYLFDIWEYLYLSVGRYNCNHVLFLLFLSSTFGPKSGFDDFGDRSAIFNHWRYNWDLYNSSSSTIRGAHWEDDAWTSVDALDSRNRSFCEFRSDTVRLFGFDKRFEKNFSKYFWENFYKMF